MWTTRRTWKPGDAVSTMKQVMPPRPFAASVRAKTMPKSARSAPLMKILAAVDDPVVAVLDGGGLDGAGGVAAAGRLGEAEEAGFSPRRVG